MTIVKQAFENHARRKRRGFGTIREYSVGASEIGLCERRVGYLKHYQEPDPDWVDNWGAAQRGITFEQAWFVPAMRRHYGDRFVQAGGKQERLVLDTLSATPDSLLIEQPSDALAHLGVPDIGDGGCIPVECKTIDPRVNLNAPKSAHVFQVIVQLGLLRRLTQYKPDHAVLAYTNASWFSDTVEFAVTYDEKVFGVAQQRADRIMQATSAAQLRPEGWIAGGDECRYCPYAKACRQLRSNLPDPGEKVPDDPQFLDQITTLAIEERERAAAVRDAELEHKEAQENIKALLREKQLRVVKTSAINVTWSTLVGRPSYDMPAFKAAAQAAGVDLQRYERVGENTDRLVVSLKSLNPKPLSIVTT